MVVLLTPAPAEDITPVLTSDLSRVSVPVVSTGMILKSSAPTRMRQFVVQ